MDDGLSDNRVFAIIQDRTGFMWFGTRDGLNRFEGNRIQVYRHNPADDNSLCNNYVHALLEDARDNLWIGTRGGLSRYDQHQDRFTHWRHDPSDPDSLSNDNISALVADPNRRHLWIAGANGLNRLHLETGRIERFQPGSDAGPDSKEHDVRTMAADGKALWLSTFGLKLWRMPFASPGRFEALQISNDNGSPRQVSGVAGITEKGVWLAGSRGLFYMDHEDRIQFQEPPQDRQFNNVRVVIDGKQGDLWVGDGREGLSRLTESGWVHIPAGDGIHALSDKAIRTIYRGRNDLIWIGTYESGVNLLVPTSFSETIPIDEKVTSLAEIPEGRFWIGVKHNGLFLHQSGKALEAGPPELADATITALRPTADDHLWVGSREYGLHRLNARTGALEEFPTEKAGVIGVEDIQEDDRGNLWLGTPKGLALMEPGKEVQRFEPDRGNPNSIGDSRITRLLLEKNFRNLWIGTWDAGLQCMSLDQPGRFFAVADNPTDPSAVGRGKINALYCDQKKQLWVASILGLRCLDASTGMPIQVPGANQLPRQRIHGITGDARGILWLTTAVGLFRYNPETGDCRLYDRFDGLTVDDLSTCQGMPDSKGNLVFGGIGGIIRFHPGRFRPRLLKPKTALTALSLNNLPVPASSRQADSPLKRHIAYATTLALAHYDRNLSLAFSALDYTAPSKHRYQYRLDPWDQNWTEVGTSSRKATYSHFPAGRYTFRVRSGSGNGVWGPERQLTIRKSKPPWLTAWAIAGYVLLLLAAGAAFYGYHRRRTARMEHLEKGFRESDSMKDRFLTNTTHELSTPLHSIIGLAQTMVKETNNRMSQSAKLNLQMIIAESRRLKNLVNDILDFSRIQEGGLKLDLKPVDLHGLVDVVLVLNENAAREKDTVLLNKVPENFGRVSADEDRLQQVLYNLIDNGVKLTTEGSVTVSAEHRGNRVFVEVRDTGTGISPEAREVIFQSSQQPEGKAGHLYGGIGLGLSICRQLVQLHGGQLTVDSESDKGNCFKFDLAVYEGEEPVRAPTPWERLHAGTVPTEGADLREMKKMLATSGKGFRILVVDDEAVNRKLMRAPLDILGHHVTEAADGYEALAALMNESFDLILLDIMMPRMSGYEVCRKLRERYPAHELPVIFLSGRNQVTDLTAGFAAGANDFLSKPVAFEELVSRIDLHLRLIDSIRELERQKQALIQTQQQMMLQDKLVSLGTLTSGIGHEINNPTNYVFGSAQNMSKQLKKFQTFLFGLAGEDPDPDIMDALQKQLKPLFDYLDMILEGSNRIAGIVRDLQTFSRRGKGKVEPVEIDTCLRSTLNLVRPNFKEWVIIEEHYGADVTIPGNQSELNQVFMNLAVNACQAVKSKVKETEDVGYLNVSARRESGEVVIRFSDTGKGIPEKVCNRIFEPFFTTKPEGEGTGLGLSISFGIVQDHDGRIEVDSVEGSGTTFTIRLPTVRPDPEE
ncbi:MAG: ATP-binding protein [Acidobacteriota bacterium]|nr:ATP-binding protein [Acidobacteriota bacterium]